MMQCSFIYLTNYGICEFKKIDIFIMRSKILSIGLKLCIHICRSYIDFADSSIYGFPKIFI